MENPILDFFFIAFFLVLGGLIGLYKGFGIGIRLRIEKLPIVIRIYEEKGIFYAYEWVSGEFLGQNDTVSKLTLAVSQKIPGFTIIPVIEVPLKDADVIL